MPTKLTLAEQRKLIRAMPAHRVNACKTHCQMKQMQGEGISDILKSIGSVLGPIAREVGPTILKELILPFLQKKMSGNGLNIPGSGLNLPGKGKPKKKVKRKPTKGRGLKLAGVR